MRTSGVYFAGSLLLFFAALSVHHYLLKTDPPANPPFAQSMKKEDLLLSLQWYAEHALGALNPKQVRAVVFDPPASSEVQHSYIRFSDKLLAAGIFLRNENMEDENSTQGLLISAPFRSQLWWSGLPHKKSQFHYSPYSYKILGIDAVTVLSKKEDQRIKVAFRWSITAVSKIQSVLEQIGIDFYSRKNKKLLMPASELRDVLGEISMHEVVMLKSKYGYFLPLTRKPNLGPKMKTSPIEKEKLNVLR